MIKFIAKVSRILIGIIFIFSGFVKAVDPLGSKYKFSDYFFAMDISWLDSFALFFAVLMSGVEFIIGIMLLFNFQKKLSRWLVLLFMSFFTILTLWIALKNPVTDCGCFGDAIILSNWETFYKNLIIMIFVITLFVSNIESEKLFAKIIKNATIIAFWGGLAVLIIYFINTLVLFDTLFYVGIIALTMCIAYFKIGKTFCCKVEIAITSAIFILITLFSIYCYRHLPIIDFRPFKNGNYILDYTRPIETANFIIVNNSKIVLLNESNRIKATLKNKVVDIKMPIKTRWDIFITDKEGNELEKINTKNVNNYSLELSKYNYDTLYLNIGVPQEESIYYYTMKNIKDNSELEITSKEYMDKKIWEDTSYVFITEKTKGPYVIKEGYEPPVHEIIFRDNSGNEYDEELLLVDEYVFVIVSYNISDASAEALKGINNLIKKSLNKYKVIGLSASNFNDIEKITKKYNLNVPFYWADDITLKTMIRSNPGIMLFRKGVVINKWHYNDIDEVKVP